MFPLPALLSVRVLIVAAVALAAFAGGMSFHKIYADRKIAILESAIVKQAAEWDRLANDAQKKARYREAELQHQVDQKREEADEAIESIRAQGALLAAARVDLDRLRRATYSYAAGRGAADTVAACQARADRLGALLADGGELLEEGRDLVAACAVRADERAVKLAACLKAWPQ